jgi:hypothetical protein
MQLMNMVVIQPMRSLIRYHHLKKTYNTKYRMLITFRNLFTYQKVKAFAVSYFLVDFLDYDFVARSNIGNEMEETEYEVLLKRAT